MADPDAATSAPGGSDATGAPDRDALGGTDPELGAAGGHPSPQDGGSDRPRTRALAVAVALSLAGPAVAFALAALVAEGIRTAGISLPLVVGTALIVVLTIGAGLGGVALLYMRRRPDLLAVRTPSLRDWLATLVGVGMMFGVVIPGAMAVTYLQRLTGVEPAENNVATLAGEDPTVLLVLIPLAFLVIGPGEELLFRGAVQGRLRQAFDAPVAIAIAAALFAGIHFAALGGPASGRFLTIGLLFLPAAVLGAAYEYSGNLVVPALMHGAYDAILFALLYLFLKLDLPAEGGAGVEAGVASLLSLV